MVDDVHGLKGTIMRINKLLMEIEGTSDLEYIDDLVNMIYGELNDLEHYTDEIEQHVGQIKIFAETISRR